MRAYPSFGQRNGALVTKAQVQPVTYRARPQPSVVAPFRGAFGNAFDGQQTVGSLIPQLFGLGRPTHVTGDIVPIRIDPIQRVAGRRLGTETQPELLKRLKTKLDASSTVPAVRSFTRIAAALFCLMIRSVFGYLSTPFRRCERSAGNGKLGTGHIGSSKTEMIEAVGELIPPASSPILAQKRGF